MIRSRKLSKKRGITIPKELAAQYGIYGGEVIDITADAEGVHIKKHVPVCRFCGRTSDVKRYIDIDCCIACAYDLKERICDD